MAGHIYNELIITFTDNNETGNEYEADITAENIVEENMKLTQSICDENYLKFGGCIASEFSIELINTNDRIFTQKLIGRWISVKLIKHTISNRPVYPSSTLYPSNTLYPGYEPDETPYYIFSGFIQSAKLSENDSNVRTIVAYDALAKLYEADATNYVYTMLQQTYGNTLTIGVAINRALRYNGSVSIPDHPTSGGDNWKSILNEDYDWTGAGNYTTVSNYNIKNDAWKESTASLSYGELLKSCCEDIAAFGVIIPNAEKGTFKLLTLKGTSKVYEFYEKLQMEEYVSTGYTDFIYSTKGNSNSKTANSTCNYATGGFPMAADGAVEKAYDFTKNVTIYEPSSGAGGSRTSTPFDRLIMTVRDGDYSTTIGYRIAMNSENGDCAFDNYRPLKATVEGTPEQLVGKPITIIANKTNPDGSYVEENGEYVKERINTYVFKRTLSGIQALTDEIEVKGQR